MSEQYEWIMWQVLSDTMRLILISIWVLGVALVVKATRNFWRGFREWERITYGDK
jgi:hypothetical protein